MGREITEFRLRIRVRRRCWDDVEVKSCSSVKKQAEKALMLFRKKKNLPVEFSLTESVRDFEDGRRIIFNGYWAEFDAYRDAPFISTLLPRYTNQKVFRILGAFEHFYGKNEYLERQVLEHAEKYGPWDFFDTGENVDNRLDVAKKAIGFRLPKTSNEIRFPIWQRFVEWEGFPEFKYHSFGERFAISKLKSTINQNFGEMTQAEFNQRSKKAVLVTSHIRNQRLRLATIVKFAMGCDFYGRAFTKFDGPKKDLIQKYLFNLCPENSLGEGYITEKIPEAFLSGCIPITYCHPDDLARDFNPKAVVNLCGLSNGAAINKLKRLANDYDYYMQFRSEPLLINDISIKPLLEFVKS